LFADDVEKHRKVLYNEKKEVELRQELTKNEVKQLKEELNESIGALDAEKKKFELDLVDAKERRVGMISTGSRITLFSYTSDTTRPSPG
jgi:hypothetical protein